MKKTKQQIQKRSRPQVFVDTEPNAPCPASIQKKTVKNLRANASGGLNSQLIERAQQLLERIKPADSAPSGDNNEQGQAKEAASSGRLQTETPQPTISCDRSLKLSIRQCLRAVANWVRRGRPRGRTGG